jgi:hypothetical protein
VKKRDRREDPVHASKHPETGIIGVPYGERWRGKKRAEADAVDRPTFCVVPDAYDARNKQLIAIVAIAVT